MCNKCYFWKVSRLENNIEKSKNKETYIMLIHLTVPYASEIWPLRKVKELRLNVFERDMLR